jgi:hypothetical protein
LLSNIGFCVSLNFQETLFSTKAQRSPNIDASLSVKGIDAGLAYIVCRVLDRSANLGCLTMTESTHK